MLNNGIALLAIAALFGVEAFRVKDRLPRVVLAALAVIFATWAALVKSIADAWPKVDALVTAISVQPVSWFVLAIALFFVLRPFWHRETILEAPAGAYGHDASEHIQELAGEIQRQSKRTDDLSESISAALEFTKSTDGSLIEMIRELNERLTKHQEHMAECYSAQDKARLDGLKGLREEMEALRHGCANLAEEVQDHRERAKQAFHTLWLRERMAAEEAIIRRTAAELYDPFRAGESYDEERWKQRETLHKQWETAFDQWLNTATFFGVHIIERTLRVDDEKYGGTWTVSDSQFPNSEAVRRFKKFRIIFQQWEQIVPEVTMGIHKVAFDGLTQQEVRNGGHPR